VDTRPNRIHITAASGGLFVTIEDISSGAGVYPVIGTPVYNEFKSRFLYKGLSKRKVDAVYAGDGYHTVSSTIASRPYWSDEKKVAISWTGSGSATVTLYIGGRWGQPTLPSGTILSTGFIAPDKTIFPLGSTFDYVIGLLVEDVGTKTNTLQFYGAIKGSPVTAGTVLVDDRISFTSLGGRASFHITLFSTGVTVSTVNTVTNFTTDATAIAHIPIADQIKVLTFSSDYNTVTTSIVNTSGLGSGTTFAQKIREEGLGFSLVAVTHAELGIGGRELWVCSLSSGLLNRVLKLKVSVGVSGGSPVYFSARFAIALVNVSDSSGNETNRLHINGSVLNLYGTIIPPADGYDWTALGFGYANYAELKDTLVICAFKSLSVFSVGFTLVVNTVSNTYKVLDPSLDIFSDVTFGLVRAPVSLTHTKF
jgi:hypothetical protein